MKNGKQQPQETRGRGSSREALFAVLVTLICLLPFIDKAFHIDDPQFLWAAEQIQRDPLDFYGFDVNWQGVMRPMFEGNKNPPLLSFYLAGATALLGWSEVAVHLAMLLPAAMLALGIYWLAAALSCRPLEATLLAMLSPLILISSTTVMSDVLMLALWCGGLGLWIQGLERPSLARLLAAAVLLGLCSLTKYFGLAALPLAALYAALTRRAGSWLWVLLIPLLMLGAYFALTYQAYGLVPFADVAGIAGKFRSHAGFSLLDTALVAVLFLGGGLIGTAFYIPFIYSPRAIALQAGAALLMVSALVLLEPGTSLAARGDQGLRWGFLLHAGLFGFLGLNVLVLATAALREWRDPVTVLLCCWLLGVFVFSAFLNWAPNGRSLLPAAVPASILIMRRLGRPSGVRAPALRLLAASILALWVTVADYALAGAQRDAVQEVALKLGDQEKRIWFQGSWGFQWYMEQAGFTKIDHDATTLLAGDLIVYPHNNPRWMNFSPEFAKRVTALRVPVSTWATTKSVPLGAGFYGRGPLPFVFGPSEPEWYSVRQVVWSARLELPDP